MTEADHDRSEVIARRIRRILEEHTEPAPYGPQYEALHALIGEELANWLRSGEEVPEAERLSQIAGIIAWHVEAAFPVGPQRTPDEWTRVLDGWRAAERRQEDEL